MAGSSGETPTLGSGPSLIGPEIGRQKIKPTLGSVFVIWR